MNVREFRAAYKPFKDAVLTLLAVEQDCGPFDGGCVLCALALQQALGGTVMVLTRSNDVADHAVLLHQDKLWDMDGPLPPSKLVALQSQ